MLKQPFNLSPYKAIKWFESKGYTVGWDWYDVWQREHTNAFTVAKAMSQDILMDIRTAVDKALDEGLTGRQFRNLLETNLKSKGWWCRKIEINPKTKKPQFVQLGSPCRLNTIYQTNMQASMMSGCGKLSMTTRITDHICSMFQ